MAEVGNVNDVVTFETGDGAVPAIVVEVLEDTRRKVWYGDPNEDGAARFSEPVPRNDDGGQGRTWRP